MFWFGLRMFVIASISIHFIRLIESKDFSAAQAAALLSIFAVATIPSRLALGAVTDRVRKNRLAAALGLVQIGALVILLNAHEFWHLIAFVLVYAIAWGGGGATMITALRADYFGLRFFATIGGMINTVVIIGIIVGPFTTGLIYDRTGSYTLAIWGLPRRDGRLRHDHPPHAPPQSQALSPLATVPLLHNSCRQDGSSRRGALRPSHSPVRPRASSWPRLIERHRRPC